MSAGERVTVWGGQGCFLPLDPGSSRTQRKRNENRKVELRFRTVSSSIIAENIMDRFSSRKPSEDDLLGCWEVS